MTGWRHASAFIAVVALLLDAHTGVWAQASDKRTDTFEQRFPLDQMPTPPAGEQSPSPPPVRQAPNQPSADQSRARRGVEQKLATVTTAQRLASARRSRSRVVVAPRSFLDAGTELLPGDRKFLDYALPPLHTPTDVVTNLGGRVGWHRSPLPGPLFPGPGPW
jgi:hypothetical protein